MTKQEFLQELRDSLSGEVSQQIIAENVAYYSRYIDGEIAKGKTEEEVIRQIGRGSFIAKSILEAQKSKEQGTAYRQESQETEKQGTERKKGLHAERNASGKTDIKFGSLNLSTWYGKLLLILLAIVVIVVVIAVVGGVLTLLWHIAAPLLLLAGVFYLIVWFIKYLSR